MDFEPSREAGRKRLADFVPHAGQAYASRRNYDLSGHPHVSGLSPYIRHRLITEDDVVRAVLETHTPREAEKFIAEVYWRTYWKGWLELRPTTWDRYKKMLWAAWNRVQTEDVLRADWRAACEGKTGIDCFDHWAHELAQTGYLHNHARMWFASIWIFTLRLPWALGADFFLRHLLDGDPASNTLSWRWVGGLQTVGKTYLADPDNIARYTNGRFCPQGLASVATPLPAEAPEATGPCPQSDIVDPAATTAVLVTHEDLSQDALPAWAAAYPRIGVTLPSTTPVLHPASNVTTFRACALRSTLGPDAPIFETTSAVVKWAKANGITQIIHAYAPIGPGADDLFQIKAAFQQNGITCCAVIRPSDSMAWPHAKAGFFRFKKVIPSLISTL